MDSGMINSLRLSFQSAGAATVFVVLIGIALAYALARREFKGKEALDIIITLPMILPPTVTGYYLLVLFGRNGIIGGHIYDLTGYNIMFTWHAAVLASFIVSLPLMVKAARAAIESVDIELINASYTLGHSEAKTAFSVILPLARRGIIAGAVLSFARAIGEFGATLMLAGNIPGKTDTMPLAIYSHAANGEWGKANVLAVVFTLSAAMFLFIANRMAAKKAVY